jgi:hypothetical protein
MKKSFLIFSALLLTISCKDNEPKDPPFEDSVFGKYDLREWIVVSNNNDSKYINGGMLEITIENDTLIVIKGRANKEMDLVTFTKLAYRKFSNNPNFLYIYPSGNIKNLNVGAISLDVGAAQKDVVRVILDMECRDTKGGLHRVSAEKLGR